MVKNDVVSRICVNKQRCMVFEEIQTCCFVLWIVGDYC